MCPKLCPVSLRERPNHKVSGKESGVHQQGSLLKGRPLVRVANDLPCDSSN